MQNAVRWVLVNCVEGDREMERNRRQRVKGNTDMCLRDLLKLLYFVKGLEKYLQVANLCLATAARLCK
jgi:hypothetical protein